MLHPYSPLLAPTRLPILVMETPLLHDSHAHIESYYLKCNVRLHIKYYLKVLSVIS